jgi:hypothetical protein
LVSTSGYLDPVRRVRLVTGDRGRTMPGPKGKGVHAAAAARRQPPGSGVTEVMQLLSDEGPMRAGRLASRLRPKHRRFTRSILEKASG